RLHPRIPDDRSEVHVLVQLEPYAQQEISLEDPGPHPWIADGSQQDRVARTEPVELVVGQSVAGSDVAVRSQVELDAIHFEPTSDRIEDLERLGDHLGAGAVPTDHPYPVGRQGLTSGSLDDAIDNARLIAAR